MTDIKLIVTDMDGTFLNSNYEVSSDFPAVYEELKKRNILLFPLVEDKCQELLNILKKLKTKLDL